MMAAEPPTVQASLGMLLLPTRAMVSSVATHLEHLGQQRVARSTDDGSSVHSTVVVWER